MAVVRQDVDSFLKSLDTSLDFEAFKRRWDSSYNLIKSSVCVCVCVSICLLTIPSKHFFTNEVSATGRYS